MIVTPNVRPPAERRGSQQLQWGILLTLMVLIYGSHAPLIALTKVDGRVPFSPSSCVILIESAKLLTSLAALLLSREALSAALSAPPSPRLVAPYAVPALLYALNNNLVVFMQAYMDPSSYQVLSNLKIASTALLYSLCLGRRLRPVQWSALGLLTGAGVCHSYSSLRSVDPGGAAADSSTRLHITTWGVILVLLYCLVSGLAAVYTERVLKSQRLPLSLQNLYLYAFGVAINGAAYLSGGDAVGEGGFLEGYSAAVWAVVAGQAANGLLMSVVLKHGSGITRLFVISSSMLVNALLSWAVLRLELTPMFLLPVAMTAGAAYLYYT
ncbi:hypothetical protein CRUP_009832 [Coryphaenoides rupestris]|nr:hypothetical protein CRUP_009832 [Coryphaenoides rupestris]